MGGFDWQPVGISDIEVSTGQLEYNYYYINFAVASYKGNY
jgi:hypothetical protein